MTETIRVVEPGDLRFLRMMLVAALLWRPKRRWWPTSVLLLFPQLRIFKPELGQIGSSRRARARRRSRIDGGDPRMRA